MKWQECLGDIGRDMGRSDKDLLVVSRAIGQGSINKDTEFLKLLVAVIAAESGFNSKAQSSAEARGLMQLTPVGEKEARTQCNLGPVRGLGLMDPITNVKYGSCLLQHYLSLVDGNVYMALVLYNGGFGQLTRLETRATLVSETSDYVHRVHHYLRRCQ